MTIKTDLSRKQLATILSALDDAPRNPANKGEALRAIGRSATKLGLTTEDVLAAAPGLLDERLSPADFRAELQELAERPEPADAGQDATTEPQEPAPADEEPAPAVEPTQAADAPTEADTATQAEETPAPAAEGDDTAASAESETATKPTVRPGTKQALMIDLLKRPEGATVEQIAEATGWQHHTIRGAISGALEKKLGLTVEATRTREVGADGSGAKGSSTVYRSSRAAETAHEQRQPSRRRGRAPGGARSRPRMPTGHAGVSSAGRI